MAKTKIRWGDTLDDEDALPPSTVKGPDSHGVKVTTEYFKNANGEAIKKVTKVKVVNVEKKVYKVSEERRQWKRFGAAAKETAEDSVTVRHVEDIPFERIRPAKATAQEKKFTDMQAALQSADKHAIVGSLKDVLYKKRMERELLRAKGLLAEAERPPDEDGPGGPKPGGLPAAPKAGSYVPPSVRNRGAGAVMEGPERRQRDENSLRVTNLSEDVTEADLQELFRPFGPISRVFLAIDRTTGENRGFAFVNYHHREDAERAMRTLDGYGYDNLILHVELHAPAMAGREARPSGRRWAAPLSALALLLLAARRGAAAPQQRYVIDPLSWEDVVARPLAGADAGAGGTPLAREAGGANGSALARAASAPPLALPPRAPGAARLARPYNVCVSAWMPMVDCTPGAPQETFTGAPHAVRAAPRARAACTRRAPSCKPLALRALSCEPRAPSCKPPGAAPSCERAGYQVELFRMLASEVGLGDADYALTCLPYGDMLADLADPAGGCSLSAAGVEVSVEHLAAGLKFSWPTYKSGLRVMIHATLQHGSTWAFSEVFHWTVWLALGGTTVAVGLIVGLLEWATPQREGERKKGWQSWLWYSLGKLVHVLTHVGDPGSDASRVVVLGYAFLVLVMVSMYTATSASRITAEKLVHPVHRHEGLGGCRGRAGHAAAARAMHARAERRPPPAPRAACPHARSKADLVGRRVQTWNHYTGSLRAHQGIAADGRRWDGAADFGAMLSALRGGEYEALVLDAPVLEYTAGTNAACDLFVVGEPFETFSLALAFPPGFDDAETYQGALDMLASVYVTTGGTAKCFSSGGGGGHGTGKAIHLNQVSGLWLLHNARKDPTQLTGLKTFIARRASQQGAAPPGGDSGAGGGGGGGGGVSSSHPSAMKMFLGLSTYIDGDDDDDEQRPGAAAPRARRGPPSAEGSAEH
ncbi:eif3g-a [Scenedesmus sp. PABB004]|nr:eif3g-a [Scenedesmus sp. PABB004]